MATVLFFLSMYVPSPSWTQSNLFVVLLLLSQCFLRGMLCPRPVGTGLRSSIALVIIMQGVVAPLLAVSLYPLLAVWCGEGLTRGMLYVSCLPPSSLLAVWVVKEASGRSFLCRYAMLYFVPFFCIWTPLLLFLMSLLPFDVSKGSGPAHEASEYSFSYLGVYGLVLAPLLFCVIFFSGVVGQVVHARVATKHRLEDASLQQYVFMFSDSGVLSEVLEVSQGRWRGGCTALSLFFLLFTHYVTLSFLVNNAPLGASSVSNYFQINSTIPMTASSTISSNGNSDSFTSLSILKGTSTVEGFLKNGLENLSMSSLSSRQVVISCIFSLFSQITLYCITWYVLRFSSYFLQQTASTEDSIALLFSSTFKCEALLIPLCFFFSLGTNSAESNLSTNFLSDSGSPKSVFPGLFIASLSHFAFQSLFTFLIIPLRRWRMYANCRPGTVMFPSSYDRLYRGKYRR